MHALPASRSPPIQSQRMQQFNLGRPPNNLPLTVHGFPEAPIIIDKSNSAQIRINIAEKAQIGTCRLYDRHEAMSMPNSLKRIECFFLGRRDVQITLTLGKIVPERIQARKCERCNRVLIPLRNLDPKQGKPGH